MVTKEEVVRNLRNGVYRRNGVFDNTIFREHLQEIKYDLKSSNLEKVDLRGANMIGADMSGANMREANMRRANMIGANMRGANMRRADMSEACMREAIMSGACMRGADMRGAYMRGVYMRGADMRGANMRGADMRGTRLQNVKLIGAEIDGIIGLSPRQQKAFSLAVLPKEQRRAALAKIARTEAVQLRKKLAGKRRLASLASRKVKGPTVRGKSCIKK